MSTNEQLENVIINKGTTERLQRHAIGYLQDQFKILYKAIEHLAIDKREGERLTFKINNLIEEAAEKLEQFTGLQIHSKILMEERDRFVDDLKDMMEAKKSISKDLLIQRYTLKDKIGGLEIALKKKTAEFEAKVQENFKLDKQNKTLLYDRDKSKQRIQKLMQRKGKFDSGIKSCKKCNKEYNEKENFNWSCRTHQSEWGGELWWCCGKRGKEMPGCKYSKHESKDEENDSENEENEEHRTMKYTRCYCCKELGHNIDQCTRDPNLKTGAQMAFDWERIQRIKDFRKLYVDTVVQTTQYLKNAVKIPRTEDEDGDLVEPDNT